MAGERDLYQATIDRIDAQLDSLRVGAPAAGGGGSWTTQQVEAAIAELEQDSAELTAHWHHLNRVVGDGAKPTCAACGRDQPCDAARALFAKYHD